jgi:hypothetical protein
MTAERSFDEWVCRRLAEWPATQIVDFKRWLGEHNAVEFVPAVHEALLRRGMEPVDVDARGSRQNAASSVEEPAA